MTERPAWHTDEYPELRAGPPWQMEEMIDGRARARRADPGAARAEGIGEAVRAAAGARQPVVVTGCGTSEHAALGVAAQLDEALRVGGRARRAGAEARQAFEAALDPRPGGVHHRRLPRRRHGAHDRGAGGRGRASARSTAAITATPDERIAARRPTRCS